MCAIGLKKQTMRPGPMAACLSRRRWPSACGDGRVKQNARKTATQRARIADSTQAKHLERWQKATYEDSLNRYRWTLIGKAAHDAQERRFFAWIPGPCRNLLPRPQNSPSLIKVARLARRWISYQTDATVRCPP